MQTLTQRRTLPMSQVLLCGALIVTLSMGVRHGFGLWLQPITMARDWSRETFAFALAVQNLAWGIAGPIAGGMADRFGAFRVLVVGAVLYAAGLATMALAATGAAFTGAAGLLVGVAQAGCTYAIVYGVIGRNVAPERRTWAMGVTAAAGSFGQFLMVPVESALIGSLGWDRARIADTVARLRQRLPGIDPALLDLSDEKLTLWIYGLLHRYRLRGALSHPYLADYARYGFWGKSPFGRTIAGREIYPPAGRYRPRLMVTRSQRDHDHVLAPMRGNQPPWHLVWTWRV